MSDHRERACTFCGTFLHHEDICPERLAQEPIVLQRKDLSVSLAEQIVANIALTKENTKLRDVLYRILHLARHTSVTVTPEAQRLAIVEYADEVLQTLNK